MAPSRSPRRHAGDVARRGLAPEEGPAPGGARTGNEIESEGGTPAWFLLLAQFSNVLILILLAAVALSAALGHAPRRS